VGRGRPDGTRRLSERLALERLRLQVEGDDMPTVKDVIEKLDEFRTENRREHEEIKKKQDQTNSNVTALQVWRARMEGAAWVVRNEWRVILAIATIAGGSVGVVIKFG